jgi:hypothetical protein
MSIKEEEEEHFRRKKTLFDVLLVRPAINKDGELHLFSPASILSSKVRPNHYFSALQRYKG